MTDGCARLAALALVMLALTGCDDPETARAEPPEAPAPGAYGPLPPGLPAPYLSGVVPTLVPARPDSAQTPEQSRPWFDAFSWQMFIAMNWPASGEGRGNALNPADSATFLGAANGTPTVWGTYKASWELFDQGSARPTPFDDWNASVEPCGGVDAGHRVMGFTSKGNSVLDESAEAFSYPLVDQQRNYARFEVRYNRAQYDTIRGPDANPDLWLYLSRNWLGNVPFQMPASDSAGTVGAIMVKAAWRPMTAVDDTTRYYTMPAQVADSTGACTTVTVGLVGFHVASKLEAFPEWIWSTFEHVSNVPGAGASGPPYSFNNGLDTPLTPTGWAHRPTTTALLPEGERVPVQVTRLNDIPNTPTGASTQDINEIYRQFLSGTVWSNYQLVMTQWPSLPSQFTLPDSGGVYPRDAGAAFPQYGATNTVMETYFQARSDAQGAGGNSCMQCHWQAGKTDFSWGMLRRAH